MLTNKRYCYNNYIMWYSVVISVLSQMVVFCDVDVKKINEVYEESDVCII